MSLKNFADLDSALTKIHNTPKEKSVAETTSVSSPISNPKTVKGIFDLEAKRNEIHDPKILDWEENPIGFKEFCESKEHMNLLPKNWKEEDGEGALSDKQYKDCMAILGDDPKTMFDPTVRKYVFGVLLWSKGCIDGNTFLHNELDGKDYTIKSLVANPIPFKIKTYCTKKKKVVIKDVVDAFSKGSAKKYKIRLKSGKEIIVGEDHKFFDGKKWVTRKDLEIGKKIAIKS